jgi:hypothetical protein
VDYHPEPIPTAAVRLSSEILELTERLAKNTHDVWARQRFAEGWTVGPRRDDQAKQHPGLVPYEQLTESEKEYDRGTAIETLKAVMSLGYRIEKNGTGGSKQPIRASTSASGPAGAAASSKDALLPWDPATLEEETSCRPAFRHPQVEAIRRRVEMFNGDAAELRKSHPGASIQSKRYLLSEAEEATAPAAAKAVLERYAVADQLAMRFRRKSSHAFRDLFIGAFLAMAVFEFAGHGFHDEASHVARPILLSLYLVLWGVAVLRWSVAWSGDYQERHLDYRALAEGLRVQFFWRLLGIPDRVEDHYLDQQRSELEWIRYALRKWRALDDAAFPPAGPESNEFLALARQRWVKGQFDYFTRAAPAEEKKGRKCRRDGKVFFAVNVVAVVALLVIPLAEKAFAHDESGHIAFEIAEGLTFVVAGLALVVAALRIAYAEKMAFAEHAKEYEAIRQLCANAEARLADGESLDPFRELGREALSENGDWLLTHRERPLEVPIP